MTLKALTVEDVARELGRSPAWLYEHWQELVDARKLPPPLLEKGGLVWSAAQLYALLDKPLTAAQRAAACAYRAAHAAALASPQDAAEADTIAAGREALNRRFARTP